MNLDSLPLKNIFVLDFTKLLPGPFTSLLLQELGATIVRVDSADPKFMDWSLSIPPKCPDKISTFYHSLNRGKHSIAVNLKDTKVLKFIQLLISRADVILEGFRPGVMTKIGLDYQKVKEINPSIIFCSISGYGARTGPLSNRAGHDINYISDVGITSISSGLSGAQIADISSSLFAALSISSMLSVPNRKRAEMNTFIDISLAHSSLAFLTPYIPAQSLIQKNTTRKPKPIKKTLLNGSYICYSLYSCADDHKLCVGALEPKFWSQFCLALEKPNWIKKQFTETDTQNPIFTSLVRLVRSKSGNEWKEWIQEQNLNACISVSNTMQEALETPHFQPWFDKVAPKDMSWNFKSVSLFPWLHRENRKLDPAVPPGTHTIHYLQQMGYSSNKIQHMLTLGVVRGPAKRTLKRKKISRL